MAEARGPLEAALGVRFGEGENLSYGVYFRIRNGTERANLYDNYDKEYAAEGKHVRLHEIPFPVLFEIDGTERADEYERLLSGRVLGLVLIRRAAY